MSIKHMNDVWESNLSMRERLVALAIADCANDEGVAWPGYDYLISKTGMARATLSKAIKNLVSCGWCNKENHSEFGKGKKVNVYIIIPKVQQVDFREDSPKVQVTKSSRVELPKVQYSTTKSSRVEHEPSLEPPIKEKHHSFDGEDCFNLFWGMYPRKGNKKNTLNWWVKNVKSEEKYELVMDGLKKHLPSLLKKEKQYIPLPSTWLNGSRWEDEIEETKQDSEWV